MYPTKVALLLNSCCSVGEPYNNNIKKYKLQLK